MVGKKVMLKIKHRRILIYDDNVLLASYEEAQGKNELIGNRLCSMNSSSATGSWSSASTADARARRPAGSPPPVSFPKWNTGP
ncbi:MAG TPA: hypothetical protein ENI88_02070 [Desulfobulbus sp.]|nr:hypothetical protein [Desulfobulbus sp.]